MIKCRSNTCHSMNGFCGYHSPVIIEKYQCCSGDLNKNREEEVWFCTMDTCKHYMILKEAVSSLTGNTMAGGACLLE